MAPRLKVFSWSDGFHAYTVAASSRPKALEAWGVQQDLFKSGLARELNSGPDHDAALATPGQVVRRGEVVDKGELTRLARPPKAKGPTRAQRERVTRLESELESLDLTRQKAEAKLEQERQKLEARAEAETEAYETRRSALRKRLDAARRGIRS